MAARSFLPVAMFAFSDVEAINVEHRQFVDLFSLPRSCWIVTRGKKFVDSGVKRSEEEEEEAGECCDSSTN